MIYGTVFYYFVFFLLDYILLVVCSDLAYSHVHLLVRSCFFGSVLVLSYFPGLPLV